MTLDLDELERIGKAATAGPWEADQDCHSRPSDTWCILHHTEPDGPLRILFESDKGTGEDTLLLVAARNNWQAMIDEIRRLSAENAKLLSLYPPWDRADIAKWTQDNDSHIPG